MKRTKIEELERELKFLWLYPQGPMWKIEKLEKELKEEKERLKDRGKKGELTYKQATEQTVKNLNKILENI